MNKTTLLTSLALAFSLALTGCGDKKKDDGGAAKTAETAGKAPAKKSSALTEVQAAVDAAKTKEDIDAIFDKCMGAMIDMGMNGVAEPAKDPAYRATCKYGLERKRAALVLADSTPDKMNPMCLTSAMQLEELAGEGGPEAEEMKKLAADVDKACGF